MVPIGITACKLAWQRITAVIPQFIPELSQGGGAE
jgi:hypothetical protein